MTYTEWIRETVIHDLCLEDSEIEQLDNILCGGYDVLESEDE